MSKNTVTAPSLTPPVAPYSHAVVANGFVFTAGQLGVDPNTQALVSGGIQAQTAQALDNVNAVLQSAGSSLDQVVKVTVFILDMNEFAAMNEVYARYFWRNQPARSAVQVARLPIDGLVEIETIAVVHQA